MGNTGSEDAGLAHVCHERSSKMRRRTIIVVVMLVLATAVLLQAPLIDSAAAKVWKSLGYWAPNVLSMTYDPTGNRLYCGTSNQGCALYDFNTNDWDDMSHGTPLQDKWTPSVAFGLGSTLYAATDTGVYLYDGTTWVLNGLNGKRVNCLAYDSTSHILYAGTNDGVWRSDLDIPGWVSTGGPQHSGTNEYVNCLLWEAGAGTLYAGTSITRYGGAWSMAGGWAALTGLENTSVMSLSYKGSLYAGVTSAGGSKNKWGVWKYSGGWIDTGLAAKRADSVTSMEWQGNTLCAGTMDYGLWYSTGGWTQDEEVKGDTNCLLYLQSSDVLFCGSVDGVVYKGTLPSPAGDVFYLAEGTTAWGFSTYITIMNPNDSAAQVEITYMTSEGQVPGGTMELPAGSQLTVNPVEKLGNKDFSTRVVCKDGKRIAVDRTVTWTGEGAKSGEGHNSVGVVVPAKTWYLPEGSSKWGFETWLLIQNPNGEEVTCNVTYMIEGEGSQVVQHKVTANSRATFNMENDIGQKDASIKVACDKPVIPERSMYRNNKREGHDSIGTTSPATEYYLAEGATGYGPNFITYVLVQNPQETATDVTVTYLTGTGETAGPSFQMAANSRKTIKVNDQLPANTDVSTKVTGTQPIIAERAMYWGENTPLGEACHDSIGLSGAHKSFFLPDGQTSDGRETWTLVANPNADEVEVEISYLTSNGQGNVVFQDTVPANARKTFNMADKGINGRAAVMVTSKTSGQKIMVERAMYWNNRGAGTDTIGGYSD